MRDYQGEIERSDDPNDLRALLETLADEIDWLEDLSYQDAQQSRRAHDLQLLMRYGENKLEKLLS